MPKVVDKRARWHGPSRSPMQGANFTEADAETSAIVGRSLSQSHTLAIARLAGRQGNRPKRSDL